MLVVDLKPVVVPHPCLLRVVLGDPHGRSAAEQCQHVEVVLKLGVNGPFRVWRQVTHGHLDGLGRIRRSTESAHLAGRNRRPVGREPLAHLQHPLVVDIEALPPGERAERDQVLDVRGERRVPPFPGFHPGPFGRRDHLAGLDAQIAKCNPLIDPLLRDRSQLLAGPRFQGLERFDGEPSVGGSGKGEDHFARVDVGLDPWPSLAGAFPLDAVSPAQLPNLDIRLPGHPLGADAELLHKRSQSVHLCSDLRVVALDRDQFRHGLAGDRLAVSVTPVPDDPAWLGQFLRGVMEQRSGNDVRPGSEMVLCQL